MLYLLWHGASVYNGHLRGPVTPTPIAERLAVDLSLPVFTILVCRGWDSNTQPFACGANALIHCATAAFCKNSCFHKDLLVVKYLMGEFRGFFPPL